MKRQQFHGFKGPKRACARCDWQYPEDVLLSPVIGSLVQGDVCGICALEIVNAIHGSRMRQFHGEMAEYVRLHAREARRNGSAEKPAVAGRLMPARSVVVADN